MQKPLRTVAAVLAIAATSACGGGGGGGGGGPVSPPPPPPVSPPPAPPPPPPPPSQPAAFYENNSEYVRDYSKGMIHASAAYAAGGTGLGIVIAVIDTGVDLQHAEFSGTKLHPASIDIYQAGIPGYSLPPGFSRTLDDQDGHGTGTASAAAGNKLPQGHPLLVAADADLNDTIYAGMHGVAFDAQIMAIRADEPDPSCAPDCNFDTGAIAAAIDYAVAHGADVINISLGGDDTVTPSMLNALQDAVDAGVVIIAAAGNAEPGQPASPNPDFPASFAALISSDGKAIAVGAVDSSGNITSFSARAGTAQDSYLVAPGAGLVVATAIDVAVAEAAAQGITSPCAGADTCYDTFSAGTSFASPQVAGAVALLLDAFPALAPEAAVDILLRTAADRGDPGTDAVYGRGLLDLAAAFGPLGTGTLSFGGGAAIVPLSVLTAPSSGATGDWLMASGLLDGVIMRDDYRRAFTIDPEAAPAESSALSAFEAAALGQRLDARRAVAPLSGGAFGYAAFRAGDDSYIAHPNLLTDETLSPELSFTLRQGPMSFAMGRGFAAPSPLSGSAVSTLTPAADTGFIAALTASGDWASIGYDLGAWSLSLRSAGSEDRSFSATTFSRQFGLHDAGVEIGAAHEERTALGGAAGSRLGGDDAASTSFIALAWRGPVAGGWTGSARLEGARARLDMPSYVEVTEDPLASAWTLSLERPLTRAVDLGLTLAQPLRAESGGVAVIVPVGVTATNASILNERFAALTPSGREIDLETALRFDMGDRAEGRLAVRLADDPGHVASADAEAAVWLGMRWTR